MWATSPEFDEALHADSRRWATRVEITYQDEVVHASDVVVGGYVGMDSVAVRRELQCTFVDADGALTPTSARDLLAPKGTEIRPYRGLYIPQRDEYEWIPLGVFGVVKPEVRSHSEGVVVSVKGFDRVDAVRMRRFTDPWVVKSGTFVTSAIRDIVTSRINVPTSIAPSSFKTPEIVFDRLSSPWDAVRKLADNAAMTAYFDALGSLVIGPAAGRETGITYTIGNDRATLMNVSRDIDATETYSGIMVRIENPDKDPFYVQKWDMDPKSPTYSQGPFGRRPFGFFSELIQTVPQAQAVADKLFEDRVKMREEVEITTLGTPGHDIDDVFTVLDPRSKTDGQYRIISATVPLRANQEDMLRWRCMRMI